MWSHFDRQLNCRHGNVTNVVAATTQWDVELTKLRLKYVYFVVYKTIFYFLFRVVLPLGAMAYLNFRLIATLESAQHNHAWLTANGRRYLVQPRRRDTVTFLFVTMATVFIVCAISDVAMRLFITVSRRRLRRRRRPIRRLQPRRRRRRRNWWYIIATRSPISSWPSTRRPTVSSTVFRYAAFATSACGRCVASAINGGRVRFVARIWATMTEFPCRPDVVARSSVNGKSRPRVCQWMYRIGRSCRRWRPRSSAAAGNRRHRRGRSLFRRRRPRLLVSAGRTRTGGMRRNCQTQWTGTLLHGKFRRRRVFGGVRIWNNHRDTVDWQPRCWAAKRWGTGVISNRGHRIRAV